MFYVVFMSINNPFWAGLKKSFNADPNFFYKFTLG